MVVSIISKGRSLESTPTWIVAIVCFVLVAISIVVLRLIERIGWSLKRKKKYSLYEAYGKIKSEIMLLGFISLLLTSVGKRHLSEICIPASVGQSWNPCNNGKEKDIINNDLDNNDQKYQDPCLPKGKVQFISADGINQLRRFIFVLVVFHVLYCVITLILGSLKMKKWKSWEEDTKTIQYQRYNDPERFRFARDTTIVRRHLHCWSKSPFLLWIVCLFWQFLSSVAKVDYLTLRYGFIAAHLTPRSQVSFNFHEYINRSLEEDFKIVVGIRPLMWFCSILFLLTNTNEWYSHYWLPTIPLIIIVVIGAKLQVIITKMVISILERGDVVRGTPLVQTGDDLFWFNRPRLILFFIHFVLFQNAFQLAFFAWTWYEFGYPSCYHDTLEELIIRIGMGVIIQALCSYVTLPLYALVSQMGSTVKPIIFSERVTYALRAWHISAKKRLKQARRFDNISSLHGNESPARSLPGHSNHNSSNKETADQSNPKPSELNDSYRSTSIDGVEITRLVKEHWLKDRSRADNELNSSDFSSGMSWNVDGGAGPF